jgi:hypothetical protein
MNAWYRADAEIFMPHIPSRRFPREKNLLQSRTDNPAFNAPGSSLNAPAAFDFISFLILPIPVSSRPPPPALKTLSHLQLPICAQSSRP